MPTYERKTSDIFISDELRQILEIFADKSKIAKNLLHRRLNKDLLVENHVNYISISKSSPGKISYLSQERIEKISKSSDEDYWDSSMRYICKPGGFVSKIFKDARPSEVEEFATLYKTFSTNTKVKFKVVSGEDIAKYYHQSSYYNQEGSLGNSCMKYNSCQEYFSLYIENKNIISMLVLLSPDDGTVLGRALLWEFDGNKVMDRIYTIQDDIYLNHISKWAIDNGYIHKSEQNWQSCQKFNNGKEDIEKKFSIKLDNYNYNKYPYLDSFKWLDTTTGIITNFKPDLSDDRIINLSNSDGRYESHDFIEFCEISRDYHHSDEIAQVDDKKYHKSYLQWSNTLNKWILESEAVYSEELEDYIYKDDSRNNQEDINRRKKEILLVREPKSKSTSFKIFGWR